VDKIIIAGCKGFVGREISKLFPEAEGYDLGMEYIRVSRPKYDVCFICVPTPMNEDGSCDITAVENVIKSIGAKVYIIRSTIPPETTEKLGDNCVFTPEYVASSSPYPAPLGDIKARTFHIIGGKPEYTKRVRKLLEKKYPPTCEFMECSALTAEIIKYMENSFIANYVTFCNEFYEICQKFGADYDEVRRGFLLDPRMTKWWTYVYTEKRGWGGHCLGKDCSAIIKACENKGYEPKFLKAIVENNKRHRGE